MSTLANKVIAITGASGGIGLATAHLLASRGCILSLADISSSELQSASSTLQSTYPSVKIHAQVLDVTSSSEVDSWVENIVKQFGRLDGAANLAGVLGKPGPKIEELEDEVWDRVMGINGKGLFYCVRAQLRVMGKGDGEGKGKEAKGGSIVNAASIAGLGGAPGLAIYSASKHAVIGLTKSAAKEVGERGIRLNCIAPGRIETTMVESVPVNVTRTALGRQGQPEEVAQLIAFLLSDESCYITGSVMPVDGGWTCGT